MAALIAFYKSNAFTPDFGDDDGIMYMSRPVGEQDYPDLQVGFWYDRDDYAEKSGS